MAKTGCNSYRAPSAVEAQRRGTLILALRLREGFVEEKLGLEGWGGPYRQDRGMWLSRQRERNEQKRRERKIYKAHLGKVEQRCV